MIGLRARIGGVPALISKLREIDVKVARKAQRQALNEAAKPILKDAKAMVPIETKTLKKALGKKAKSFRGGLIMVVMIGVRKDKKGKKLKHKRKVGTTKSGKDIYRNPINYAHLVEFGHRIVAGGSLRNSYNLTLQDTGKKSKSGKTLRRWKRSSVKATGKGSLTGHVAPRPFLRPALDKNKSQVKSTMRRGLSDALKQVSKR